ncbi:DNA integrity scanning diadenylate cyclase DisA [Fusobacterium perfoetens]|uniref:DNA integrity scanning diadenylate cyclase DisA n=1 Tax=Fusobacterium perfoetens TaxID=852 RepID=UPI0004802915|nr:DNA integrity scanning diadenylate cyclase DisA [Fusobacterium perfoetens]MCI6151707.1 DNA integrity scanning diadenylate cyclase DisA [Fusobacterium perfoetens]MDY3236537.1 DNA integrity scanning diadenylate cyclase DisA [Fusobacterium perfoetens]
MNREKMLDVFNLVQPGTKLREGLDNILDGSKGALIVVGMDSEVQKIIDGGFFLECEYTPERLFELSKMDGAIILDEKVSKILYANVHLQPNIEYTTDESGTRHRTAQRAAKQLKNRLVIAISERKRVLTLYKGEERYKLKSLLELTNEASQALNTVERYTKVLEQGLGNLTILELDDMVTVEDVCEVLQKFEMLKRIKKYVYECIQELGDEGKLINLQLEDLLKGIEEEEDELLSDYYLKGDEDEDIERVKKELGEIEDVDIFDTTKIAGILGLGKTVSKLDNTITPKGYRILSKFGKLNDRDIETLVEKFGELPKIQEASIDELVEIKGISKFKANAIKKGIERLKFTVELDK